MADLIERKKLLEHLPDLMKQFLEMKEIMQTEDIQFSSLDDEIERVLNNAFIEDCDEYGIQKYETLLGITPSSEDTLDSRKSRVLFHWDIHVPYSYQTLIDKLNAYCGVNNYTIAGDQSDYYLEIALGLQAKKTIEDVNQLLEDFLPVNIAYAVLLAWNQYRIHETKTYGELAAYTHQQLREETMN